MMQTISGSAFRRGLIPALLAVATLALAYRLFHMIDRYAVDLLFYDQIELYEVFLDDPNAWDLFRFQHGPHRQGLPFLGTWLLAQATDWNARADAFHVFAWVVAAAALALALRRRLFGPFTPIDVVIPLLLFTPAEYGIFMHAPNASHGAGPLLFLLLFCHALRIADRRLRYAALVALDLVLVHTGFAIFAGALTPVVLGVSAWRDRRAGRSRDAAIAATGVVLCFAWIALFLVHYTVRNGLDAVATPPRASLYPIYVAKMFANVLGLKAPSAFAVPVGAVLALASLALAGWQLVRMVRTPDGHDARDPARRRERRDVPDAPGDPAYARATIGFFLPAFTLLFCGATAVGRIQFGLSGAESSRYVPLVAPAFLGLHFAVCGLERRGLRFALGALVAAALVHGSFPMHPLERGFMEKLAQKKRSWVAAYRETGSVEAASRAARLRIDPFRDPRRSTDDTFAYLRAHRLSFFADR